MAFLITLANIGCRKMFHIKCKPETNEEPNVHKIFNKCKNRGTLQKSMGLTNFSPTMWLGLGALGGGGLLPLKIFG